MLALMKKNLLLGHECAYNSHKHNPFVWEIQEERSF